jgi:hypothetical protein
LNKAYKSLKKEDYFWIGSRRKWDVRCTMEQGFPGGAVSVVVAAVVGAEAISVIRLILKQVSKFFKFY